MTERCGRIDDLIESQKAEVDRHDLDNWAHAAERRTDTAPGRPHSDSGVSLIRSSPNSASKPLGAAVGTAIAANILAHEEHPLIAAHGVLDASLHRLAIRDLAGLAHGAAPGQRGGGTSRTRSASGSQGEASAKARPSSSTRREPSTLSRLMSSLLERPGMSSSQSWNRLIGTALLPVLDFLLVAIKLGIEHGMGAKTIGPIFQELRPLAVADCFGSPPRRDLHGDNIHAVHGFGGNAIALRMPAHVDFGFGAFQCGAHRIAVVFADEEDRHLP